MLTDVGGEAVAGDAADARADHLDADHERRGEKHRPEQAVAVLRARLRVGGDAARVVVRRAGDEARAQALDQRDVCFRVLVDELQSILAPERRTTSAHFAESRRMSAANSSGVPPPPSLPSWVKRSLVCGSTIAALMALFSLSRIGRGSPAGAITPLQALTS